ncbi:hypothetical protein TSMEX_001869, partial [Taenia solium]
DVSFNYSRGSIVCHVWGFHSNLIWQVHLDVLEHVSSLSQLHPRTLHCPPSRHGRWPLPECITKQNRCQATWMRSCSFHTGERSSHLTSISKDAAGPLQWATFVTLA